ncbi:MAG TPA: SpoIVB peptidase [Bacillota bacterium]|nr:SpoIVB peptidase [Bacillota bacterium]
MRRKKQLLRPLIGLFLMILIILVPFIHPFKSYLAIPNDIIALKGHVELPKLGSTVNVTSQNDNIDFANQDVTSDQSLIYNMNGLPIKKINLSLLDDIRVVPGGQSIGIQLQTLGVLVVGHHLIKEDDAYVSPGEEGDIEVGDIILKINDEKITKADDIAKYIKKFSEADESLNVTIKRGDDEFIRTLQPIYDKKENKYRLGLYIRDSTSGIGTITFYDIKNKKYGALGHVISDIDTNKPIEIYEGSIKRSQVNAISKGKNGRPGEKKASFSRKEQSLGTITKNTPFGIFGELNDSIEELSDNEAIPIALSHEIKEGPAKILTVVEGETIESFDIEIVSSSPQKVPSTKGMIIKVTDEKLLNKTGGIVQGMSGSPIIQNGKLIGAVTHVFVNEPQSGYGIHIEWMLQEAGMDIFNVNEQAS